MQFSFSKSLSDRATNTINEINDLLYGVSLKEKVSRNANYMSRQDELGRTIDYWEKRIQNEKNENGDLIWLNNIKKNKNETKTSLGKRLALWNTYLKKIKNLLLKLPKLMKTVEKFSNPTALTGQIDI